MKNLKWVAAAGYFMLKGFCYAEYHTNTITTPGGVYAYSVDGGPAENPTIDLVAGVTNILVVDTDPVHPVIIVNPGNFAYYGGASPQDVNAEPITLTTPPSGFPTTLYYSGQFKVLKPYF